VSSPELKRFKKTLAIRRFARVAGFPVRLVLGAAGLTLMFFVTLVVPDGASAVVEIWDWMWGG
jgi:hypothetical protein